MEFSSLSYIIVIVSFLLILKQFLYFTITKNKNCPPSPPSLPIIGHLHLLKKPLHHALSRLADRYGPVLHLRFGSRPVLVVSSASVAEECFTKNDIVFANRVHFPSLKHLSYNFTAIGNANYGPHWRNLRRIATVEVLSSHRLNSFIDLRAAEVHAMIRRLYHESNLDGSFTKIELKSRLFEFSLNNMMRMIAGKRSEDSEEVIRFQKSVEEVFKLAGASNLGDFLPILGWIDLQGVQKKLKRIAKYRNEILQKFIDEHKFKKQKGNEGIEEERTMIGDLLTLQKTDPEYYTDQIIKGLVIGLLSAGTDTSSNTMEWAMALLLNNPDKLKKAHNEIYEQLKNERLLQESDISNLPYLQCVISETLRLYPAAPLLVPHESSEDCMVAGYVIPRNTMLLVNAYSIQRDGNAWLEPTKFMPERFLGATKDGSKMFPFGMGRRSCPGEGLANRVVGLVVGTMIQCFGWDRVDNELTDMREGSGLTLPKAIPLQALYKPRESMRSVLSNL